MTPPTFIKRFVEDRSGFSWLLVADEGEIVRFELTSGTWKSGEWRHEVVVAVPPNGLAGDACVIYVTGGDSNPLDIFEAQQLAARAKLPVALLFHIPNQPLFGDRWEDDLIAHTFEQYLDTGDPEWPLLFPMVRAVVRCMDMLQESRSIGRFVITGASKRGWTTWLASGLPDERVIGIAPMVFDNLKIPAQMAHQVETWGRYSEQIEDYTSRELQEKIDTGRGAELTEMMDPYSYLGDVQCPVLSVNGANDRYWAVDALSLYWSEVPDPKRCLIVPNAGHLLGDKIEMIETVSAFAAHCAAGEAMPTLDVAFARELNRVSLDITAREAERMELWVAASGSLDFRDSVWALFGEGPVHEADLPALNVALLPRARFSTALGDFNLALPVKVLRPE